MKSPDEVVDLGLAAAYIPTRQAPQRQAGEASVRGSAEEAPEGHWGVLLCSSVSRLPLRVSETGAVPAR